ncbi:MAG: nucleotide exchange factor GrpE [Pseudomonadota bacterium]
MIKDNHDKKTQAEDENSPEKKSKKIKPKKNSKQKDMDVKDNTEELKDQLAAEKDRFLRLSAEFENYKKRKQRESNEFKKFANEMIFKQLLSVVDNLERAISAAEENKDEDEGLLEGVILTHKEIITLLETFNVKAVEAQNQTFDPNFHQAVTQDETDEHPENTVITVLQKGFLLHDRLLRPAMVVVSKKTEKEIEKTKEN